ncbi:Cytochrome P450 [Melia azedarach]|uniref:Cytochrome P450 n=1 Tax=Melia azedarach TaxID=155640 RepID=A0ACC1YNB6_MELAZ|nr:Cytochrome P450 [Melia azedarach]
MSPNLFSLIYSFLSLMELVLSSFPVLVTFLLFVFMVLKIGKKFKGSERSLNLPPGPWKLPIIGNLPQLVSPLPHRQLRNLANKYGPLMYLQIGELPTVVVSSPEFAKEVMTTHDIIFASRVQTLAAKVITYNSSGMAFAPYGDQWRQLRKLCVMEVLSAKKVQSFRSIREQEVSNLIAWIASKSGSVINLTDKLYSLMCDITSKAAFGNKCEDREIFISIMKEVIELIAGANVVDLFPSIKFLDSITGIKSRLQKMHQQADKIFSKIIVEHKQRKETLRTGKNEDLVDVLLNIQEDGNLECPITTDNIKALIFEIFGAGSETSAATLDWALSEMMKNPRVMKKAQDEVREVFNRKGKIDETSIDELQFLKLVIKETLRLHSPLALLFPRECRERCKINGFDIPAKAKVIVNAWAMARDPKYWSEAESFIPERFLDCSIDFKGLNFEYIPFGAGRRICPGMTFANASIELPLAMLLYHFDWKLPSGMKHEDLDMTETFGLTVKRRNDLCIIPIPYHPSPVA